MSQPENQNPKSIRFCPWCGTRAVPPAGFCAACGEPLQAGSRKAAKLPGVFSWGSFAPGLTVLSLYLVVGLGLWIFVLNSHRVASSGEGRNVSSGASLPADHPPITLPDDVKRRVAEMAAKAEASPQDLGTWKELAQVQFRASQIDSSYRTAALTSYQHILELAPNDLEALRGVGNVYYDLEEYAKAIEYYQKYLALQPEDSATRTDMGTMYLYGGDPDRAIAEYQAVVAQNPTFFQAHFNLGIAYQEKGEREKAIQALTRAKEVTSSPEVRQRVDQILAQISSGTKPASGPTPEGATLSPFQRAVEEIFRGHESMGPKVSRMAWSSPTQGIVYLRDFPMSGMPSEVRERFLGKLRTKINEVKVLHSVEGEVKIDMVDATAGEILETISV